MSRSQQLSLPLVTPPFTNGGCIDAHSAGVVSAKLSSAPRVEDFSFRDSKAKNSWKRVTCMDSRIPGCNDRDR